MKTLVNSDLLFLLLQHAAPAVAGDSAPPTDISSMEGANTEISAAASQI